jgi:hypothetical protein
MRFRSCFDVDQRNKRLRSFRLCPSTSTHDKIEGWCFTLAWAEVDGQSPGVPAAVRSSYPCKGIVLFILAADEARIEAAGNSHVGSTLHQRPSVRKHRDGVLSALETQ